MTAVAVAEAQAPPTPPVVGVARVRGPIVPKLSRLPARELPQVDLSKPIGVVRTVPRRRPNVAFEPLDSVPADDLVQRAQGSGRAPDPLISFDGISATGSRPPDTVGDVGPNHYVQMVNTVFQVWDKNGTSLVGPSLIDSLWSGAGGRCDGQNAGDPIVLYDPLADRWLISQFAFPAHQCIAISTGADPTGTYHLYEFGLGDFPDYPKFAVWPDAYYMGANSNPRAFAYDRSAMLSGNPATSQEFNVTGVDFHSMLAPGDLDVEVSAGDQHRHQRGGDEEESTQGVHGSLQ
ncbi:MAG: hypothetical protein ACE5EG_11105 [Thermoanaerobaculia bacterium]